ncbi:trafficking kinesin-binding protein 1-like, partial [Poecilia formosa]|uniref:trafficking kinesin-binding protein 1-like n=1 Tax=Poecilia formosa TaxID=48698 RepID=UPI0007B907A5
AEEDGWEGGRSEGKAFTGRFAAVTWQHFLHDHTQPPLEPGATPYPHSRPPPSKQIHFPGKCLSHTSSTYTFTTCRILHPSDQLTSVSPSPAVAFCQSGSAIGTPTHTSSPVPFSAPHTPSYTPCCTPRRLSLSLSLSESSTNLRDSTKTTSTSLGLVRLLLERGISASVYDPCSWDRGLGASGASTPTGSVQVQSDAAKSGENEVRPPVRRPDTLLLQPCSPPCSPPQESASAATARPAFQFSPSKEDPPYYDAFLASKPARTILREVLMDLEREYDGEADEDGQNEVANLGLVDKLKRFRTLSAVSASVSSGSGLLAPFSSSGLGGGLPGLNAGLRRNRSYPAMVGASMAMKDPGGPPCALIPQTMQTSQPQGPAQTDETGKVQTHPSVVRKAIHIPQTLHALEPVTPHTVIQRHARANWDSDNSATQGQDSEGQTRTW